MISSEVFYARLAVCKGCEFWSSVCLKGHPLQSPMGCPLKKFDPVDAAAYYPDLDPSKAVPVVENPECCGKGRAAAGDQGILPMPWPAVVAHLMDAAKKWKEAGFPMVDGAVYEKRITTCKACPSNQYRWFQCKVCRCIIFSKAKLATESCPAKHW